METFKEYVQKQFRKDIDKDTISEKQKAFFHMAYDDYAISTGTFVCASIKHTISKNGNQMFVLDLVERSSKVKVRYYLLDNNIAYTLRASGINPDLLNRPDLNLLDYLARSSYIINAYNIWLSGYVATNVHIHKDIWKL